MAKWILIVVGVVVLSAGAAAYVAMSGTPPIPTGACPALLSSAPYDANVIMYADLTSLRTADLSRQLDAIQKAPEAAKYRDFVDKTNFHFERDLDHILLTATASSSSGSLVLEGRFDQAKFTAFAAPFGTIKHYEAGDMYVFHNAGMQGSFGMMFLGPNRLALAGGPGAETQILMLADASKGSDPGLHDDLCARVQRVSGAPFFVVGDIPKVAAPQLTALVAHENPSAAEVMHSLRGWDLAYWMDGENLRIALEGQFDSRYEALQARISLDKLRDSIQKSEATGKVGPMATGPSVQVLDALAKNLAFSLDGRYVRLGTAVKMADLKSLAAASASGRH
jgi:hypothetical protein